MRLKALISVCWMTAVMMGITGFTTTLSAHEDPINPGIDMAKFVEELTTTGSTGWVHGRLGSNPVFVYRQGNFFHYHMFPLISHIPAVRKLLSSLERHDKLWIKGKLIENGAPQKHIYVTEAKVLETWEPGGGEEVPPYEYSVKIPDDLVGKTSFIGKVHYATDDGLLLVCEYRDAVIPVVGIANAFKDLYRNDKIRVHFKIAESPGRPAHLMLDPEVATPVEVLAKISDIHNKPGTLTGTVVKYSKSPEISMDVFALMTTDSDLVSLDYTLVNFQNMDVFMAVQAKVAAAWEAHRDTVVSGRNKLINPRLKVTAKGLLHEISPSQANPQIVVADPADATITFE